MQFEGAARSSAIAVLLKPQSRFIWHYQQDTVRETNSTPEHRFSDRLGVDAHGYAPIPFTVIDEWIRTVPGIQTRLEAAIDEAHQVIAGFDNEEWPGMDAVFYEQGYNEFRIVLRELLDALDTSAGDIEPA